MGTARSGIDFCRYCSNSPRHPCRDYNWSEIMNCPNASEYMQKYARESLLAELGIDND